jgi:hypothetical protein
MAYDRFNARSLRRYRRHFCDMYFFETRFPLYTIRRQTRWTRSEVQTRQNPFFGTIQRQPPWDERAIQMTAVAATTTRTSPNTMTTPSNNNNNTKSSSSSQSSWNDIVSLAFVYYYRVFLRAFVLGMVRVLWLEPIVRSAFTAVALEVPVVLFLSWYIIHKEAKHAPPSLSSIPNRMIIGWIAFAMLMTSEFVLFSLLSTDKGSISIVDFVRHCLSTPDQRLGLCGQVLYGCIPAVHAWSSARQVHPAAGTLEGQSIKRV